MIICFTGTGNTRHIADILQDILGDELVRLAPGLMSNPEKVKLEPRDGRIIWAFPIHGWRMPMLVREVIKYAKIESETEVEHFMVATCGDDVGMAAEHWRRAIGKRGWKTRSAFSVTMPNTYVCMRGFDVDAPEVADAKLALCKGRAEAIAEQIEDNSTVVNDVVRGKFPFTKTYLIYPLFSFFKLRIGPFHTTDACTGCGRCARNCPLLTISIGSDKRPHWKGKCAMCLRCYHQCPNHAIAFGSATKGKGQYIFSGYSIKA